MAYKITDACVSCGTCEGECPVGAISAGDGKYDIDADGRFSGGFIYDPLCITTRSSNNI